MGDYKKITNSDEIKPNKKIAQSEKKHDKTKGPLLFILGIIIIFLARPISQWYSNYYLSSFAGGMMDTADLDFITLGTFLSFIIAGILISLLGLLFIALFYMHNKD